jgi:AraC-like DNA-binding protein
VPAAALRGLVVAYRGFRDDAPEPTVRREPPSAVVPVILDLGAGWHVAAPASGYRSRHLYGFTAGMHDAYALTEPAGPTAGIQVDLSPLGARRLFGVPMHELANDVFPLEDLLGGWAAGLRDRLGEARSWSERFAAVDQVLAGSLQRSAAVSGDVEWAWRLLESSAGRLSIGRLGAELGWSRKRLAVHFRDEVGLTPKAAARVLRFQALVTRLRRGLGSLPGPQLTWADLALECGYYDQSHLVREVGRLAGVTPRRLLAQVAGGGVAAGL